MNSEKEKNNLKYIKGNIIKNIIRKRNNPKCIKTTLNTKDKLTLTIL